MASTRTVKVKPTYNSIVASAEVITAASLTKMQDAPGFLGWQADGWRFYDDVGEFRSGINWVSNGLSRVNLVAARPPQNVGDEPTPLDPDDPELTSDEARAIELVSYIGGGPAGQGAMMTTFGQIIGVGGFAWLIIEPDIQDPNATELETWGVYTQDLVKKEGTKQDPKLRLCVKGDPSKRDSWRDVHPNALIVKVWRPNPRRPWEPDSHTKGVLRVLTLLDLLTAHVTATGRSRLAGAGILVVPNEVEFPTVSAETDEGQPLSAAAQFDGFLDQLVDAMTTPIKDRDNAAAVVPLPVQVPAEYAEAVRHITFSTDFDDQVLALIEMAITRLAIGLDMPPEVLKGLTDANHWTAWQVEETAITLHIEPMAEIVCQGLTEGYLEAAFAVEEIEPGTAIVWYDTTDLTTPPDRSSNAEALYDRGEASGTALRRHSGMEEDDAPDDEERMAGLFRQLIQGGAATSLKLIAMLKLGMIEQAEYDELVAIENMPEDGGEIPEPGEGDAEGDDPDGPPPREDRPQEASVVAVVAACDVIMHRALERAGAKLKTQIGRKAGGPATVQWTDMATLHTEYDATQFADLDMLLEGAWARVPDVASFLEIDSAALEATLNAYARALLASQLPHDRIRLMGALGADALA